MVFIWTVYTNSFCGMDRCVAIRICRYRDHSLSHLDKAWRKVFRSNMQYTCCSCTGVQCFCHIAHGTNTELKRKKEKLIGLQFCEDYLLWVFSILWVLYPFSDDNYMFKVNNKDTRTAVKYRLGYLACNGLSRSF